MTTPQRILIVDDEADIRTILGLNLQLLGLEFGEAGNGDEANQMLATDRWDGCILDIAMPKTDGFAVLEHLAAARLLTTMPVVVLSAKASPQSAIKALTLGAHAHLAKPFSPAAVAQKIAELIDSTPEQREQGRLTLLERAGLFERLGMPTV